ncbi:MAG: LLM class flavin-dependent oxidoreductase [Acidimicrobiales bacterium]
MATGRRYPACGRNSRQRSGAPRRLDYPEKVRFGTVILPDLAWAESKRRWQRAEALGFDHAWTYDHLSWRSYHDKPWYATMPTLTAAALATGRIGLGTLVASPNFRHPLLFAKQLISLDDISSGRAIAGIGAGVATGWDATVLGQPALDPRDRSQRFAEFVALTDLLLRDQVATWQGRFYSVEDARTHPGCVQRPRLPLAIAGSGPKAMRLAARHGGYWVSLGPEVGTTPPLGPAEGAKAVGSGVARLNEACEEVGRDASTLRKLVLTGLTLDSGLASPEAFRETAGRYEEAGVTDLVVHWPTPSGPYQGDMAAFERIFSSLAAHPTL